MIGGLKDRTGQNNNMITRQKDTRAGEKKDRKTGGQEERRAEDKITGGQKDRKT